MWRLLWLIPVAIVAVGLWLVSLVPYAAMAVVGALFLIVLVFCAAAFLVMWFLATGMAS